MPLGDPREEASGQAKDLAWTAQGAVLAIQLMLTALLVVPAPDAPPLTIAGRIGFKPEWDAAIYLSVGALSLAIATVVPAIVGRAPDQRLRLSLNLRHLPAWVRMTMAGAALGLQVFGFVRARQYLIRAEPIPASHVAFLVVLLVVTAVATVLTRPLGEMRRVPAPPAPAVDKPRRPAWQYVLELAAVIVLVAIVYTPAWRLMTGQTYMLDGLLHWDYFSMGPTLAFDKGAALGTDVHTFYGFGWPLLFHALSPVLSVSYGHMIAVVVICGCVYVVGVYALIRALIRSATWAFAGTLLALLLHLFSRSAAPFTPYWGFPSLGFTRYVFDVWFFLFLLANRRTRNNRWIMAAGVLAALAVLFELDTGAYLVGALVFFVLCSFRDGLAPRTVLATVAIAALVLLTGLGVGSRWTLLHSEFWSGWFENLRATSSGFSMEPLAAVAPDRTVVMFVAMTAVYLVVAGHALRQALRWRASAEVTVLGAIALYGFLVNLYFVGRSTAYNLPRASTPFAIILTVVLAEKWRTIVDGRGARAFGRVRVPPEWQSRLRSLGAIVAASAVVGMVLTNPVFPAYPSAIRTGAASLRVGDLCLVEEPRDICGLPPASAGTVSEFRRIVARLRQLTPQGGSVAVLDQSGPVFHLAADTKPWGRYQPLLLTLFQRRRLDAVKENLRLSPPEVVLMRSADTPLFADSMSELRKLVRARFVVADQVGEFQIWRLAP